MEITLSIEAEREAQAQRRRGDAIATTQPSTRARVGAAPDGGGGEGGRGGAPSRAGGRGPAADGKNEGGLGGRAGRDGGVRKRKSGGAVPTGAQAPTPRWRRLLRLGPLGLIRLGLIRLGPKKAREF